MGPAFAHPPAVSQQIRSLGAPALGGDSMAFLSRQGLRERYNALY